MNISIYLAICIVIILPLGVILVSIIILDHVSLKKRYSKLTCEYNRLKTISQEERRRKKITVKQVKPKPKPKSKKAN